ncbi:hypothetical protein B0H14DRAFT_3424542 [Mycena olivaceomarginata]|nr:hypothetical protein B0H14DRAFT_3424542 [Mycena olivaceomarginata]
MHTAVDNVFEQLKIDDNSSFYPWKGFEHTRGSESWDFYVVTHGFVPGIYTHWEDTSFQVDKFKGSIHKKYVGWSAATSAFNLRLRPSASVNGKIGEPVPATPTRKHISTSAPSTPTHTRKPLYVYSQGQDTTIYADHIAENSPLPLRAVV